MSNNGQNKKSKVLNGILGGALALVIAGGIRKEEKRRNDESEERPFQQLAENGPALRYGG